jgi:hypothetical protein
MFEQLKIQPETDNAPQKYLEHALGAPASTVEYSLQGWRLQVQRIARRQFRSPLHRERFGELMKRTAEYYRDAKRRFRAKAKQPERDLLRRRIAFAVLCERGMEAHQAFLKIYGESKLSK